MPSASRILLAAAAALVLGSAWPAAGAAAPAPQPAISAAAFRDSVGINVHLTYASTPYGNYPAVKSALLDLGVRHLRDGACAGCTWIFPRMLDLSASGLRFTLIAGSPRHTTGTLADNLASIRTTLRPAVTAVEGPNEWDISGDPAWAASARAYQQELYDRVKADPSLRSLTVIGPSLVYRTSRAALGDLSGALDQGNLHSYPGGRAPGENLTSEFSLAAAVAGTKRVTATETGYHNALASPGGHLGVDELVQSWYVPALYLEYFRRGVARTFSYELIDQRPEAANADMQQHFGLLRSDLSRKPAYVALRALLGAIGDGRPATPRSLNYEITGGDASLRTLLFSRADGSFALALWRDMRMWDPIARVPLPPAGLPLTVRFGEPVARARTVRLGATLADRANPGAVPLTLGANPVVIQITTP